jgi:hypothetical protein
VPADHPLRAIRLMTDIALKALSPVFDRAHVAFGRPSITPEKLVRALLLQALYSISQLADAVGALGVRPSVGRFVGLNESRYALQTIANMPPSKCRPSSKAGIACIHLWRSGPAAWRFANTDYPRSH